MDTVKTWSTPPTLDERRTAIPCALCKGQHFRPALSCEGFSYVRCARCGLVQMNPQPSPADIAARYQTQEGHSYLDYELAHEKAFLSLQEYALKDIRFEEIEADCFQRHSPAPGMHGNSAAPSNPDAKTARFLDVGCATGALLDVMRSRGWNTRGVELGREMADWARRERGLDVRPQRLEEAAFPDAAFDLVHASHLIEHLNEPGLFVREVYRILSPHGWFLVTTPAIDGLQARLFGALWRSAIFDHLYLFSKKTLRSLLEGAGFQVVRHATWGGLAAGAGPLWLKRPLDRLAKKWGFGDVVIMAARKKP